MPTDYSDRLAGIKVGDFILSAYGEELTVSVVTKLTKTFIYLRLINNDNQNEWPLFSPNMYTLKGKLVEDLPNDFIFDKGFEYKIPKDSTLDELEQLIPKRVVDILFNYTITEKVKSDIQEVINEG